MSTGSVEELKNNPIILQLIPCLLPSDHILAVSGTFWISFSLFFVNKECYYFLKNNAGPLCITRSLCCRGNSCLITSWILLQIGECVAIWWRPNFETIMYPYCPPHITKPKVEYNSSLEWHGYSFCGKFFWSFLNWKCFYDPGV